MKKTGKITAVLTLGTTLMFGSFIVGAANVQAARKQQCVQQNGLGSGVGSSDEGGLGNLVNNDSHPNETDTTQQNLPDNHGGSSSTESYGTSNCSPISNPNTPPVPPPNPGPAAASVQKSKGK